MRICVYVSLFVCVCVCVYTVGGGRVTSLPVQLYDKVTDREIGTVSHSGESTKPQS